MCGIVGAVAQRDVVAPTLHMTGMVSATPIQMTLAVVELLYHHPKANQP
jgi:hypothetical protein